MKIPKATKLPSGSWRVSLMVDGQRISITEPTKKAAESKAAAIKSGAKKAAAKTELTVGEAFDRYIDSKEAVLSPSTIRGYRHIKKDLLPPLSVELLDSLTQEKVQRWVNGLVRQKKSPKTVSNAHGLLSAVLSMYRPDYALHTTLPQKVKQEIAIPTEDEAAKIFKACRGTMHELPIMLAMWLGLRESEIRGLKWEDITGEYLFVRRAVVRSDDGFAEKTTKSYSGTRKIHLPQYLIDLLGKQERTSEYIVPVSGHAMYMGFTRICKKAGLPHFRFHDLRHLNASVMLAVGMPNKYAQERMGHATDNMLKTTYQHTIKEEKKKYDEKIDERFKSLFDV